MRTRTYPRVDLSKLSNWILALLYYGLPLNELSLRKLNEKERKGAITRDLKHQILLWKESKGLRDVDELEYKYFLEGINAIKARPVCAGDLEVPIFDNVKICDILRETNFSRVKIYYLTKFGRQLAQLWSNAQYVLYELTLFWLLIRSKRFTPLIQRTLSDPRVYKETFNEKLVPSQDGISRRLVGKWLRFFGLINQNRIDSLRLAVLLFYSSIMEINEKLSNDVLKEYVNDLCYFLSESFSISQSAVDFGVFLDYIYLHTDREVIEGFPSGRGHRGLPSKPSVQILEIRQPIPLPDIRLIEPLELRRAILFGVET